MTIELLIEPRLRDLGDFAVRRVLPFAKRRHVGPFVFFDHMGPLALPPGQGMDVRPHPHIGLATVTYLFDGEIMHRDSLGSVQAIRPGDVNWMNAGRGIVHSERSAPASREAGVRLHGIQSWVALPQADEESAPSFQHHPAASLPGFEQDGVQLTLIAGAAYGRQSPVAVPSPLFYLDARFSGGASLIVSDEYQERAVYVAQGAVDLDGTRLSEGTMAVLTPGGTPLLRTDADTTARVMLLGGAPLDGERIIWWNFVSSSKDRLEQAKRDWAAQRFAAVPGETEFIPLPQA